MAESDPYISASSKPQHNQVSMSTQTDPPAEPEFALISNDKEPVPLERANDDDDVGAAKGFFQSDFFQKIEITVSALVAIYSACTAALLSLFVPQLCCPNVRIPCFRRAPSIQT
jgi:hypothetical protein